MEKYLNDIPSNSKVSVLNSIILNNYSIQNVIISPNNIDSFEKFPNNTENYFQINKIQNSYLSTPKNSHTKKRIIINIPPPSQYKYTTPIQTKKHSNKFSSLKIKNSDLNKQPIDIIQIIPVFKLFNIPEKHPKDSVKKNNNFLDVGKAKLQKLKSSLSQGLFKTIKKPKGALHNLTLEYMNKKKVIRKEPKNSLSKNKSPKNSKITYKHKLNLNLKEFIFSEQIGRGTFGNIFCVKWIKNNKFYAMKKEILYDIEDIQNRNKSFKIIQNFLKKTGSTGITIIYGNLCLKHKIINKNINSKTSNTYINKYIYYELMEKAERDWDNEISERRQNKQYYSEKEIINIMNQLIGTLSLLQKNNITHRDIKPQNVLIIDGKYKLCDFGEIRVIERAGLIIQRVRGSELYMSPILFQGLHQNLIQVRHNTYKSDVFSLGMCLFYACTLTYKGVDSIREVYEMKKIKDILFKYLNKRYSSKLILFILSMLEIDEKKRFNFIQLEKKLKDLL